MPAQSTLLKWSLLAAAIALPSCGGSLVNAPPTAPLTSAGDSVSPALGQLALEPPDRGDRQIQAWAQDIDHFEVTLLRCEGSVETVVASGITLPAHHGSSRLSALNLLPGEYRLSVVAVDLTGQAVQAEAPDPHRSAPFTIRAYTLTVQAVSVTLKPNYLTVIDVPLTPPTSGRRSSGSGGGGPQASEPAEPTGDDATPSPDASPPASPAPSDEAGSGESPAPDASPANEQVAATPSPSPENSAEPPQEGSQENGGPL